MKEEIKQSICMYMKILIYSAIYVVDDEDWCY